MREEQLQELIATRVHRPGAIAEAAGRRRRPGVAARRARQVHDDRRRPPGAGRAARRRAPAGHGRSRRPARPAGAGPVPPRRQRGARHA